LLHN
jgi:importin subunit beta-1